MDDNVHVELAVQTLAPTGSQARQREAIERLEALEEQGAIESVTVTVWGERVGLTNGDAETSHGQEVLSTVEDFREWGQARGVSVDRFFRRREVDSAFTGERYTALELPSMALGEYHGEELHWVSPCQDGDTTYSVQDRIEMLESTAAHASEPTSAVAPVAEE